MIHVIQDGSYKFPGGGMEEGETYKQTLIREMEEECGTKVTSIGAELGAVIEYGRPEQPDFDVFKMTSTYYYCEILGEFSEQKLDDYERELGFHPIWIDIADAIQLNQIVAASDPQGRLWWVARDTFVMEMVLQDYNSKQNKVSQE